MLPCPQIFLMWKEPIHIVQIFNTSQAARPLWANMEVNSVRLSLDRKGIQNGAFPFVAGRQLSPAAHQRLPRLARRGVWEPGAASIRHRCHLPKYRAAKWHVGGKRDGPIHCGLPCRRPLQAGKRE